MSFKFELGDLSAPTSASSRAGSASSEAGSGSWGADSSQGAGWWKASDGKWYPPQLHPDQRGTPSPTVSSLTTPRPTEPVTLARREERSSKVSGWKTATRLARNPFTWVVVTAVVVAGGVGVAAARVGSPRPKAPTAPQQAPVVLPTVPTTTFPMVQPLTTTPPSTQTPAGTPSTTTPR